MSPGQRLEPVSREQSARPVDDIDRRLLDLLSEDGRLSMTELADRAGVSRANAYSRIERLRADGVLLGFTTRVNPRRLGLPIAALLTIQVDQQA